MGSQQPGPFLARRRSWMRGDSMRYHVYLEDEPTLESYRLHHDPRDGLSPVFICPFVVLTDADGNLYNAMRGIQGQNKGATHQLRRLPARRRARRAVPDALPVGRGPGQRAVLGGRGPRRRQLHRAELPLRLRRRPLPLDGRRRAGRARGRAARPGLHVLGPEQDGYEYPQTAAQPPRQGDGHDRRRRRSRACSCSTTSTAGPTRCGPRWGC